MFKNSLKIIVLVGMLALSMVPAVASFSMQTPTAHTNHLKKSSLMSSLQSCRTTLRPDLLIRKHPAITLCVVLGFCAYGLATYGLIKCYSGLSPDKNGKNSNNTDSQKTVFERFKTMNTINKIKTLLCPLLFMYSFIQPQVWTEFVYALDHITTTTKQMESAESWAKRLAEAIRLNEENNDKEKSKILQLQIKSIGEEKINKNTTRENLVEIKKALKSAIKDIFGLEDTLLHFAILFLDIERVEQLIDLGEDVNEALKSSTSFFYPIHVAAFKENIEVVNLLLEKGANPNTKDNNGYTSLHKAVSNKEICRALFEHGADGNALGNSEQAPWQLAGFQSYEKWLETLYPNKNEREKAIEKNKEAKEALEKFKK